MNIESRNNILTADSATVETLPDNRYLVSVVKNGHRSYLHDGDDLMHFPSFFAAFKAVFNVRKDIPFNQYLNTRIAIF